MDPIDHTHPAFGLNQPAFDSQAFNAFANLDDGGCFNAASGFTYDSLDSMISFDECYASIPVDAFDQSGPDNVPLQPASNNLPLHAPHRQVPYDPSIGIPYTPEDTDADKIRKWENLIAHADLANAGVPASASQIIEEASVGQTPQSANSPNSLFDCPRSPSVDIVQTPSPTPSTPSPSQAPAATMAPSKAANHVTARATPQAVQLPRALTNRKNYAQHVSPFAPVATVLPPVSSVQTSRELEKARSRIQSLARERNYYQRALRKATSVDPKSGKTSLQMLQTENATLRRVNAKQAQELLELKEQTKHNWSQHASLGDQYNALAKQLHRTLIELKELKGEC
ncbi:hypothetical protein N7447_004292 [Penicillium robsamsonii]|uniref:uncharacterized protein n=1 Tax=Penicillium robsamsonii TaxID=1792511 RepID=UPI00254929B8|nr:uncharacterized protein N7447_004292 [Penicillium robsamsonii]KAJ5827529.1 hypothetical protein N7447_004292 [Penicillium robsamsonii]